MTPAALPSAQFESGTDVLFAAVNRYAERTPAATAVSAHDGVLRFGDLTGCVASLAGALAAAGARPGSPVGLCLGRSKLAVPGLLATWWLGATAVPLDGSHPAERLATQLADADVQIILGSQLPARSLPHGAQVLDPEVCGPTGLPRTAAGADERAYLIYTSGTTGRPKGVEVSYGALDTFLSALQTLRLPEGGMGLNPFSPAFDSWLWCTLLYLVHGQGVALTSLSNDNGASVDLDASIAEIAPRVVCLSPSLLAACTADMPSVEVLIVAGEACPPDLLSQFTGQRRVLNVYGPTEATIAATWADSAAGDDVTTIGRALPGYTTYVLSSQRSPVPADQEGELYLGGSAVARGYRNRPGLTASRFVPDPFAGRGSRMYRTGDLVRERPDGQLIYLGRLDDQVKIRAHRVELAEVERTATALPVVRAAAAFLLASGDALGLAIVAEPDADGQLCADHVRERCAGQLPEFMVPVTIDLVRSLPVKPTGKVDREALARMCAVARPGAGRPPGTDREKQVCQVLSSLLPQQVTDADADFFAMGGHSLLAARAVVKLRSITGLPVSMRHLLANPTAGTLAQELDRLAAAVGSP